MDIENPRRYLEFLYPRIEGTGIYDPSDINSCPEGDWECLYDDNYWKENGSIVKFRQWNYIDDATEHEMSNLDEFGWLYVPDQCKDGYNQCKLGVIFHGCQMRGLDMATSWSGWPQIAQFNDIVLLFPQVYQMCWDNDGGISGDNFATNRGLQEKTVIEMIRALTYESDQWFDFE